MSIAIRQYYTSQYIILQDHRRLITASAVASLQHNLCTLGCPQRPSLSRYHSSDSSSSTDKQLPLKKDSTATSSNQITQDKQVYNKRRRKRSSTSSYSLLQQQYKQPPQNTNENRILTRRELIRLSPRQRTIYHAKRLKQYKDSQSYLDQARTNVRSNIKFLSETADTNLKKNISTIKRLFNGEEVDSVIAEQPKITSATNKSAKRQQKLKSKEDEDESLTNGIDWERAPTEIKANFQSNIASIQNWLHQVSDGKIPSSTYINSTSTSVEHPTGSVANRISKFHQLKQSNELVMDNKWIFKNILLALLPGTLFHLYFQSLQDEMREYYDRVEQAERDKILGYREEAGVVDASDSDNKSSSSNVDNDDIGSEESGSSSGRTGLSSAFSITEGENAWEKLKIVVSDLFLGGVEEKISRHRSKQQKQEDKVQDDAIVETTNNQPALSGLSSGVPENNSSLPANSDLDPTIQALLHRIEALEQQLGTTSNSTKLKEDMHKKQEQQEQRQKEHQLKRRIERLRQSPIQNRREDKLEAQWREEEANKKEMSKVHARNNLQDEDIESSSGSNRSSSSSFSLWDVINFAKSMIEPSVESTQASLKQKIKEVFDTFVDESGEASVDEGVISSALDSTEQPREADVVSTVVSEGASDLTNTDSMKNEIQQERNPSSGGLRRWINKLWKPKPTPDI